MLFHIIKITLRGFLRYKSSFAINVIGLSTALACVILIYFWVQDERAIDKFHQNDAQLYQVLRNIDKANTGIITSENTSLLLGSALKESFPEVDQSLTISSKEERPRGLLSNGETTIKTEGLYASPNFFELLSFPLIESGGEELLSQKLNMVISEEMALRLFPSAQSAIGKEIILKNDFQKQHFQVSGVFASLPTQSRLQFDFVLTIAHLMEDEFAPAWNATYAETLVLLHEKVKPSSFNEQIRDFLSDKYENGANKELLAQQYSKRYLYNRYENGQAVGGRINYVRLFSLIAFLILLMACINFTNLSTARSVLKMKEIGVKKTIGANRRGLQLQFLGESLILASFSFAIALMISYFLLPQFNILTGKTLLWHIQERDMLPFLFLLLLTGVMAGSYPAFYLSSIRAYEVLKGKISAVSGKHWMRQTLVVVQFTLTGVFLVCLWGVKEQLDYTQEKNLGFERQNIISFQVPISEEGPRLLLEELGQIVGVESVGNMFQNILSGGYGQSGYSWSGNSEERDFSFKSPIVGYGLIETLEMALLEGRAFDQKLGNNDSMVVINEAARKMMGLENPVDQWLGYGKSNRRRIIGVVNDFNYGSLHKSVEPLIFRFSSRGNNIHVKITPGAELSVIPKIEALYSQFHPEYQFEFSFLDGDYQALYKAESRIASLSQYFSAIALLISCLGLLGLVAFSLERRKKEISIRKILGANMFNIMNMLSRGFLSLILLASLISAPIAYYILDKWLNAFAYHVDINWLVFPAVALLLVLIALGTLSLQSLKAAYANPVDALKNE